MRRKSENSCDIHSKQFPSHLARLISFHEGGSVVVPPTQEQQEEVVVHQGATTQPFYMKWDQKTTIVGYKRVITFLVVDCIRQKYQMGHQ